MHHTAPHFTKMTPLFCDMCDEERRAPMMMQCYCCKAVVGSCHGSIGYAQNTENTRVRVQARGCSMKQGLCYECVHAIDKSFEEPYTPQQDSENGVHPHKRSKHK